MATILIVEDEAEIRKIIKDYLVRENHQVLEAASGQEALDLFADRTINLVLLDLNLPGVNGIEVCRSLREQSLVPIIMVTAKNREIDELIGLEVGADDYIKKPFSPRILVARVNSLLRRPVLDDGSRYVNGADLELDVRKQLVKRGDKEIELTTNQFNILLNLIRRKDEVLTREELIDYSYDSNLPPDIYDRTIDSHIKNIRKQIEPDPKQPQYIQTVRGKGYKFNDEAFTTDSTK